MATFIPAQYPAPHMAVRGIGDPPPTPPDNGMREVHPAKGSEFTIDELHRYVNGYIEISSLPDGRYMVINEEGKLNNLPVNVEATLIYREAWRGHSDWAAADTIVGDVLLCEAGEVA